MLTLILISACALTTIMVISFLELSHIDPAYFNRIKLGIETLNLSKNSDPSISLRLQMWSASLKAISQQPIFGYGISERFNAIQPFLPNSFTQKFTHPHNDILGSIIAGGLIGGLTAFFALISAFLASLLTVFKSADKVFLGLMISIPTLIIANVSTVFFNDISSAWLAFSAYLIWAMRSNSNNEFNQV